MASFSLVEMATSRFTSFILPTTLPGCQLWLDAADPSTLTLSGTSVTQWNDKSGNGRNATQTGVNCPTYVSSTKGIRFTASSTQYMVLPDGTLPSGNSSYFIFIVFNPKSLPGSVYGLIYGGTVVSTNTVLGAYYRANNVNVTWQGTDPATTSSAYTVNSTNIYETSYISGGERVQYTNGSVDGPSDTPGTRNSGTGFNRIGAFYNNNQYPLDAEIFEIVVYSTLTLNQRQQMEGYLAWKWGLAANLPTGHPYKNAPPVGTPVSIPVPMTNIQFAPTQISGCQLWLDATDPNGTGILPAVGSSVSRWVDKSGNNRTLTTTTAGTGSTILSTHGGIPSILFNSTSPNTAYMRVVSAVNLTQFTVFAVSRCQTARDNQNALLAVPLTQYEYDSVDGFGMFIDSGISSQRDRFYGTTNPNYVLNSNPSGTDAYPLRSMCWTSTSNGTLSSWFNGNTGTTNSIGVSRTSTATGFGIGFDIQGAGGTIANLTCVSQFSEYIVLNVVLTTPQRQQVEGYLAWKWGLTANLPTGHPYKRPPFLPFSYGVTRMRQPTQWVPTQISGSALWLDAADPNGTGILPSNGSSIATWIDKSGNNNNANAFATGPQFQSMSQNKLPGMYFGGANAMSAGTIATGTVLSLFAIVRYTNIATPKISIGVWKFPYSSFLYFSGRTTTPYQTIAAQINTSGSYTYIGLDTLIDTNTHLKTAVLTSDTVSANGSLVAGLDGNTATYTSSAGPNTTVDNQQFTIGGLTEVGSPQYQLIGYIHEVVLYRAALSTTQRQQVEGYLAWKWGLQGNLPTTHPFKYAPPPPT